MSNNFGRLRPLLEILVAFLPILVLGITGTVLGTDTLLGGTIVTVGYILSILIATVFLKIRGSDWRRDWIRATAELEAYCTAWRWSSAGPAGDEHRSSSDRPQLAWGGNGTY